MLKKCISFLPVLFFITLTAYSDGKLFPGYYINLNGDTVHCNIEFNDWNINPKTIQVQVNGSVKEFGAEDVKGFGVFGYGDYTAVKVSYHLNPISGNNLPENFSDSTDIKTWFLKVIEKGYYSLYSLTFSERAYFFMGYHDSSVSELIYRIREKNDSLVADEHYKKDLLSLFTKEGISSKYFNRINNASYTSSDLGSLVNILNENRTGVRNKKKTSSEFQVEVFIGGIRNSFPTIFDGAYSEANQFKPEYSLAGGLNFLFAIPGYFKSFKIGLSVGYNGYNNKINQSGTRTDSVSANFYSTTVYSETLTAKNSFLLTNLYVMYLINPLSKIKVYVKGGLNYNFSLNKDVDVNTTYTASTSGIRNGNVPFQSNAAGTHSLVTIKDGFVSFIGSVGIMEGRSKLEFSYWPATNLAAPTGDPMDPSLNTFKYGSLGVFYYFSLFSEKGNDYK